jgi:hypothetical protein
MANTQIKVRRPKNLPPEYKYCSKEGESCTTHGDAIVAYASENGNIDYKRVNGTLQCSKESFNDPDPGASKTCWIYKDECDNKKVKYNALQNQKDINRNIMLILLLLIILFIFIIIVFILLNKKYKIEIPDLSLIEQ